MTRTLEENTYLLEQEFANYYDCELLRLLRMYIHLLQQDKAAPDTAPEILDAVQGLQQLHGSSLHCAEWYLLEHLRIIVFGDSRYNLTGADCETARKRKRAQNEALEVLEQQAQNNRVASFWRFK